MADVAALLNERGRTSMRMPSISEDFSKKEFKDAEQTVKKTSKRETVMTSLLIRRRIAQVAFKVVLSALLVSKVSPYREVFQLDL
ncbi:hypothetical protein BT69DRAFT_1329375 [Atractiella rhizophila]|nr:hypothetical protein BT69DRAFT_1329375 [Atractiella rhizophila]